MHASTPVRTSMRTAAGSLKPSIINSSVDGWLLTRHMVGWTKMALLKSPCSQVSGTRLCLSAVLTLSLTNSQLPLPVLCLHIGSPLWQQRHFMTASRAQKFLPGVRLQPLQHHKPNIADGAYQIWECGCFFIPDSSGYSRYADINIGMTLTSILDTDYVHGSFSYTVYSFTNALRPFPNCTRKMCIFFRVFYCKKSILYYH